MAQKYLHWLDRSTDPNNYMCGTEHNPREDSWHQDYCTTGSRPYDKTSTFIKRGFANGLKWVRRHNRLPKKRFCRKCNEELKLRITIDMLAINEG